MQQKYSLFQVLILTLTILASNYCLLWSFHHFKIKPYPNTEIYILGLTYLLIVIVTAFYIKKTSIRTLHKSMGINTVPSQAVFVTIISSAVIFLSDYLYQIFILNTQLSKEANQWLINHSNQVVTFITMVILAPIVEEILLRGVLLQSLLQYMNKILAIIIVSLVFTILHDSYEQWPTLFIASTLYCWLTLHYKSILPAVIAHIFNNALTFVLYRLLIM